MRFQRFAAAFGAVGLLLFSAGPSSQVRAQEIGDDAIDIQTRGPVHEAFAQPVIRRPSSPPLVPRKPPAPVPELPPDQKPEGADVQWIPGYWAWEDEREDFVWVSGVWRNEPPGRRWVPGYWHQTEEGWNWVPGYWGIEEQEEVPIYPTPPDPIPEAPPPAPAADSYFVPGCWVFQKQQYWWRPGFWLGYRPGWVWAPARYFMTPAGYVFADGHWDYDLDRRGLLFAPAVIPRGLLARPGWAYRPSYALYGDFLLGSMFARVDSGRYYFGDYYRPNYRGQGFVPLVDYRIGDRFQDPVYSYYRWQNRNNPRWDNDLRGVYAGRGKGTLPVPARTVAQAKNVGGKQAIKIGAPMKQYQSNNIKLQPVTNIQIADYRKEVAQSRIVSQNRQASETRAQSKASGVAPVTVKIGSPAGKSKRAKVNAPPPPPIPKFQGKPVAPVPPPQRNLKDPTPKKGGPDPKPGKGGGGKEGGKGGQKEGGKGGGKGGGKTDNRPAATYRYAHVSGDADSTSAVAQGLDPSVRWKMLRSSFREGTKRWLADSASLSRPVSWRSPSASIAPATLTANHPPPTSPLSSKRTFCPSSRAIA